MEVSPDGEAYEAERMICNRSPEHEPSNIFVLTPGAEVRRRNREKRTQG